MRLLLSALLVGFVAVGFIAFGSPQVVNPTTAGILVGVVVDDTGAVVAGATVDLRVGARVERSTFTDASGRFRFEKVVAGVYEIRTFMTGFLAGSMSVEVVKDRPTAAVRLALARPSSRTEAARIEDKSAAATPAGVAGGLVGGLPGAPPPPPPSAPVRVGGNVSEMSLQIVVLGRSRPTSTPRPTTRSTRTASIASPTIRSRRSRSTSTRRPTRTSAGFSTAARSRRQMPCA